jgi:hypothetical protein
MTHVPAAAVHMAFPSSETHSVPTMHMHQYKRSYLEVDGPLAIEEALSPSTSQEAILKKSIAIQYDGTSDGCDDYRILLYLEAQRI